MKPFLVDVPVRIKIWCRPDCQKRQWEVIKKARPSILFIQSDGGRTDKEWEAIYSNRKMIDESIDWECTVYRVYESKNIGMYASTEKTMKLMVELVDRFICLEDDDIPSVSFFEYCAELLERYKDDSRIECICGHQYFGVWEKCDSDYFFSKQGSIHGYATWKRVWLERGNFDYFNNDYTIKLLKKITKHNKNMRKKIIGYGKAEYYEGHVAGSEFWIEFNMYSQNRLQIIPKYNLIENVGLREDSAHSNGKFIPKKTRAVFDMKTYAIQFPLKHPRYVIPDVDYEKRSNKVLGCNRNMLTNAIFLFSRGVVLLFLHPIYFFKRLSEKIVKHNKIEK